MTKDIDVGVVSEALNDKMDRDWKNATTPPLTQGSKAEIIDWGMPDYSSGIAMSTAINTPQLIRCDGLLLAYEVSNYVQIDLCDSRGNTIVANLISNAGYGTAIGGGNALVSKGSYVKNIIAPTSLILFPLKGTK